MAQPSNELTLQSRLVYAMIAGHEFTQDERYLVVAQRGAEFMLQKYRDPLHGGYFLRMTPTAEVIYPGKTTYAHAFTVLALSHMARVTGEPRFATAALLAWRDIRKYLRDVDGGFRPEAPRDFGPTPGSGRTQNPVMHLFEALLALVRATQSAEAVAGATEVGQFVITRLLQDQGPHGARIPEWYDEHWRPLATKELGGYVDLGHQFEWSHLLSGAADLGLPDAFQAVGARLMKYALHAGYDDIDGGAYNRLYSDGTTDKDKFFWQQAECLRALMVAAQREGRPELWRRYEQTVALVKAELVDKGNGGWKFGTKRTCDDGHCDNQQPDPYHMVSMHLTALQLARAGKG